MSGTSIIAQIFIPLNRFLGANFTSNSDVDQDT